MKEHKAQVAEQSPRCMKGISEWDLERYHLGMISEGPELEGLEEHLLWCLDCIDRAEEVKIYVDAIRAGLVMGNSDLGDRA